MRKLLLLISFFLVTPVFLIFSLIFLSLLTYQKNSHKIMLSLFDQDDSVSYAALPTSNETFEQKIIQKDARVGLVKQFFASYQSPLEPYAQNVIDSADQHGLDFRLIPAIAMQESNLCRKIPANSYNCWGFGIYGGKVTRFPNFEDAIETVTKTLATQYKNNGLDTPLEIMSKYTPSNNGAWARSVTHFMEELQ